MLKQFHQKHLLETGCDEAGRGCLAGPVYAAAVILPIDFYHPLLNDSKQLTESQRNLLRPIIEKEAIDFAYAFATHEEVDRINILNASFLAMHRAVSKLKHPPEFLLIDGNRFKKYPNTEHACIIGGDGIYASIAAASILAKTYRDDYMNELHLSYPHYSWNTNKGYGTLTHRTAISEYGLSPFHRLTFRMLPTQLSLEFNNESL
ncbi:MAG: ribonuclease HII [Bacteroidetes bacterium]|nr:ribonuclease HII [Bacteroidota bacterium]